LLVKERRKRAANRLGTRCRSALENLERTIMVDPRRAQIEMREHVGPIRVTATPTEIRLEAQKGHLEQVLLRAAGCQTNMVAGGRFELYNTYPVAVLAVPASISASK
jgi:hypothetical protein